LPFTAAPFPWECNPGVPRESRDAKFRWEASV
jgi:hypothetical protein